MFNARSKYFISTSFVLFPSNSTGRFRTHSRPLTVPSSSKSKMAETIRRRVRPPFEQAHEHPRTPNRATRPISVISMAAMNETNKQRRTSIFDGPRGAILGIALHLCIATIFLKIAEGWHILDSLYFSVVIATTVGYGDITPVNPVSKIFVSIYAILSVALIGGLLQSLVERIADAQSSIADNASKRLLQAQPSNNNNASYESNEDNLILATQKAVHQARTRFRATLTLLIGACVSGALLYGRFLQTSYIDLLYFLCVSMTTVGLGDIHPVTRIGKAYAAIWLVLTSLGFANILSQYANLRLKEKEQDMAEKMLSGSLCEKVFSEIDVDSDGTLTEAEFLGYMICKLGKASPDDIRSILQRFRELDKDGSGVITKHEVVSTRTKTT